MQYRASIWLMLALATAPTSVPAEDAAAPAPTAVEATTPPAAAAATAATTPATPAASAGTDRAIVILPPEFVVYQLSVGGTEAVPELTKAATDNLLASATETLKSRSGFRLLELPALDEASQATLREHVELFKIIGNTLDFTVKSGGKPWQDQRDRTDYSIGEGLRFLAEKSGADYAFVIAGLERRQSGGTIFMQFALAAAGIGVASGAGSYVYCGIIDLHSGQLTWYGSKTGSKEFGMGSSANAANKAGAESTVAAIFKSYPDSPGFNFKAFQAGP